MGLDISGHSCFQPIQETVETKVAGFFKGAKRKASGHIISGMPGCGCRDSYFKGGNKNFAFY